MVTPLLLSLIFECTYCYISFNSSLLCNLWIMLQYKLKRFYIATPLLLTIYAMSWFLKYHHKSSENIKQTLNFKCYFIKDILEDITISDCLKYKSPEDVFMHFTFCNRPLKSSHFCAIEAASRAYQTLHTVNFFVRRLFIVFSTNHWSFVSVKRNFYVKCLQGTKMWTLLDYKLKNIYQIDRFTAMPLKNLGIANSANVYKVTRL